MARFKHTHTTDARIRAGYAVDELVSNIAADLGASRGVVIGRARRLGLSDRARLDKAMHRDNLSPAGREIVAEAVRRSWLDPGVRSRRIAALHAGRDRYFAERRKGAA